MIGGVRMRRISIEYQETLLKRLIEFEASGQQNDEFVISEIKERIKYIPNNKLYKFRKITNQNLKALANNEIWLPCASSFPDDLDLIVNIDIYQDADAVIDLLRIITYEKSKDFFVTQFPMIDKMGFPSIEEISNFSDEYISDNCVFDAQKIYNFFKERYNLSESDLTLQQVEMVLNFYTEKCNEKEYWHEIVERLERDFGELQYALRKSKAVYCMSEKLNNPKQWEDYAEMYSGFAIEYSFDKEDQILLENNYLISLFPVIYIENKPRLELSSLVEHVKSGLPSSTNHPEGLNIETKIHMQMFYKDIDYKPEYEWRFLKKCENDEGSLMKFPFVSAIYVGKNIRPRNLSRLKNIAKKLDVPIYKQRLNKSKNGYEYIEI